MSLHSQFRNSTNVRMRNAYIQAGDASSTSRETGSGQNGGREHQQFMNSDGVDAENTVIIAGDTDLYGTLGPRSVYIS